MEGWLKKKGGLLGSQWQTRYFVQIGHTIKWFADHRKRECKGCLDLSNSTVQSVGQLEVTIKAQKKDYVIGFADTEQRDAWQLALQACSEGTPDEGPRSSDARGGKHSTFISKFKGDNLAGLSDGSAKIIRESIGELEESVCRGLNTAQEHFNRAVMKTSKGELRCAIEHYTTSIKSEPTFEEAYYNRSYLYMLLSDIPNAMADINKVLEINPLSNFAYLNRGNIKRDHMNDTAGALADYNRAIELDKKCGISYLNRGNIKLLRGDGFGALEDYKTCIELDPLCSAAYYNRAVHYKRLKDYSTAMNDVKKCLEISPLNSDAMTLRGCLRIAMGQEHFNKAIEDFDIALELNPADALALNNRACLRSSFLKDYRAARKDFEKLLQIDPKCEQAKKNLTELVGKETP